MIEAFAKALVEPALSVPSNIINRGNRFDVYRNNYLTGLINTLSMKFSVSHQLVGAEYFEALAHAYVTKTPPSSPILDHYGANFPNFLETLASLNPPAYLSDVARVEWARTVAAIPVYYPVIQIRNTKDLETAFEIQFQLNSGATLIKSDYPVGTIWDHHQTEPLKPITQWSAETVAIWWWDSTIQQRILPSDITAMLARLISGTSLLEILNDATDERHATHLIGAFTSFVHTGLLTPLDAKWSKTKNESYIKY